jgi:hypothetical protein
MARQRCSRRIAFGLAWLPAVALAQSPPSVVVTCERLSEEQRASVEARARADLAVKGLHSGTVALSCSNQLSQVDYVAQGRASERRAAPSTVDTAQLVEQLLALLDAATTAVAVAERELPAPASDETAATAAPTAPAPEARAPAATPRAATPRAATPRAATPRAAATGASRPESPGNITNRDALRAPSPRELELGVGVESELWSNEIFVVVGPRLGAGIVFDERFGLRAAGGLLLASARPAGTESRMYWAGFEGEWRFAAGAAAVAGADLSSLGVTAPAGWEPSSRSSLALGLRARLELSWRVGGQRLIVGPFVLLRSKSRAIVFDEQRVLSVPLLVPGLLLDLRLGVPLNEPSRSSRGPGR